MKEKKIFWVATKVFCKKQNNSFKRILTKENEEKCYFVMNVKAIYSHSKEDAISYYIKYFSSFRMKLSLVLFSEKEKEWDIGKEINFMDKCEVYYKDYVTLNDSNNLLDSMPIQELMLYMSAEHFRDWFNDSNLDSSNLFSSI